MSKEAKPSIAARLSRRLASAFKGRNRLIVGVAGLILAGALSVLWFLASGKFENPKFEFPNGTISERKQNPYYIFTNGDEIKDFKFTTIWNLPRILLRTRMEIVPDDCIQSMKINGVTVDLTMFSRAQLCDFTKGIKLELASYLKPEKNEVQINLVNRGGRFGVYFRPSILEFPAVLLIFFALLSLLGAIYCLIPKLTIAEILPTFLFLPFAIHYLDRTHFDMRTYDVWEHMAYAQLMAANNAVPAATDCWECFHPSGYYWLASRVLLIAKSISIDPFTGMQIFSLILFMATLIFLSSALRFVPLNQIQKRLALTLIVFWPTSFLHSIRIGNDSVTYLWNAAIFFFFLKWLAQKNSRDLGVTLALCLTGWWTKSNIVVVNVAVFCTLAYVFWSTLPPAKAFWPSLTSLANRYRFQAALFLATLFVPIVRSLDSLLRPDAELWTGNAVAIDPGLRVGRQWANFVCFDFQKYFSPPFIMPRADGGGRQCFWTYVLKTSIFGEFTYDRSNVQHYFALVMSISLLGLMIFLVYRIFQIATKKKDQHLSNIFMALYFAFSILALAMNRFIYPFGVSSDFRYIFSIIFPVAIFCSHFKWASVPALFIVVAGLGLFAFV